MAKTPGRVAPELFPALAARPSSMPGGCDKTVPGQPHHAHWRNAGHRGEVRGALRGLRGLLSHGGRARHHDNAGAAAELAATA